MIFPEWYLTHRARIFYIVVHVSKDFISFNLQFSFLFFFIIIFLLGFPLLFLFSF